VDQKLDILLVDDEPLALRNLEIATQQAAPAARLHCVRSAQDALNWAQSNNVDVAMLDIDMPRMNGLELSSALQEINPKLNVIFVTAHQHYALSAHREHPSGYLLKPAQASDIEHELNNLRHPVERATKPIRIQCFGRFEVYHDGEPILFTRSAEKEILAYLVDLRGGSASVGELGGMLWEDPETREKRKNYLRVLINGLRKTLEAHGGEDVLVRKRNYLAVNPAAFDCDFYDYLNTGGRGTEYHGEYMSQYSWAEGTKATLATTAG